MGQNCRQKGKGPTEAEICLVGVGVAREVHAAARSVEGPLLQRREISIGLLNTINSINKYREDVGLGVGVDAAADVRRLALRDAVDGLLVVQAHRLVCKESLFTSRKSPTAAPDGGEKCTNLAIQSWRHRVTHQESPPSFVGT